MVLAGHADALNKGQQFGGQPGIGPHHEAQNPDAMASILLGDEQHRPARRRTAVRLNLDRNLRGEKSQKSET